MRLLICGSEQHLRESLGFSIEGGSYSAVDRISSHHFDWFISISLFLTGGMMTAFEEPPIREFADRGVLWPLESPMQEKEAATKPTLWQPG